MKLHRKNGTGNWFVTITSQTGQVHEIDLETESKQEAIESLDKAHVATLSEASKHVRLTNEVVSLIRNNRVLTCEQAINEWSEWAEKNSRSDRTYHNNLALLRKWSQETGLTMEHIGVVTPGQINDYVNNKDDSSKRGTKALRLSAIRALFRWATAKGIILNDPSLLVRLNHRLMSHSQKETKHKPVFTDDEVEFLIGKSSGAEPPSITTGFIKAAIILGRDLALRLGDICNLEWDCFSFDRRTVTVFTSKSGSRIEVPMTNRVMQLVTGLPMKDEKYLFPNEREIANDVNRRALLSVVFSRFLHSVGMDGYSFHCLRATYATTMANRGSTLEEIADALGHKGTDVTKKYIRKPDAAKVSIR